jgi:LemA protein
MVGIIFLVVIAAAVFWFVGAYNSLISLKNQVFNAWKQIDVQLKRRHDLIPNLVETVKGAMSFEQETLAQVIAARNQAIATTRPAAELPSAEQVQATAAAEGQLTSSLSRLFAVVEAYPELKSAGNVQLLQAEIARIEDVIGDRRELYNDQVFRLNTRIAQLPANLFAGLFGWAPEPFFAAGEAERARPEVDIRPA